MHGGERRILNYWLAEELGHDRLGRVFRAEEARGDRPVVLRLLRVAGVAPPDRVAVARDALRRRIRAAAAVSHPNLAAVLDFASHEDLEVLALEDVQGDSLAERAARGDLLPLDEVLWHATQIAAGLEAAHARGITHGRVSPANIRLGRDGRARLLDLGIPRPTEVAYHLAGVADGDSAAAERRRDAHALARTIQFMVVGDDEAATLAEAKSLPGLGGEIVRAVNRVMNGPDAPVAQLRAALVELARQTPADPHVSHRPQRRSAPTRRTAQRRGRPVIANASMLPAEAVPEPAPAAAGRPEAQDPGPAPEVRSAALLVPPAEGWTQPAAPMPEERGPTTAVLVPEARPHRPPIRTRLAAAARARTERVGVLLARLRGPSTLQFVGATTAGALLVFAAIAVVQWRGSEAPADPVVPAAEVAAPPIGQEQTAATPAQAGPVAAAAEPAPMPVPRPAPPPAAAPERREVGALRVSVTPGGALVSLDDGPWRPAPVSFIELPPGVHRLRISHAAYGTRTDTVTVHADGTARRTYRLDGGRP